LHNENVKLIALGFLFALLKLFLKVYELKGIERMERRRHKSNNENDIV
jgi:hypothetical protein